MPDPILTAILIAGASGLVISQISSLSSKDDWYDCYHNYNEFGEEYTDIIDNILNDPNHGKMGPARIISLNKKVPGEGVHYYYRYDISDRSAWFSIDSWKISFHRVGLRKVRKEINGRVSYHYVSWSSPSDHGIDSFTELRRKIMVPKQGSIRVVSIDISSHDPSLLWLTKICKNSKPNQIFAMKKIVEKWNEENDFNVKTIIYGEKGVGKTYTAMLLKKYIDEKFPNAYVRLYDDFDPSAIGVNIKKLALSYASENSPVVLVVNEIDIIYEKVIMDNESYDPREQHTRNKQSFNNMLDTIANTKYVISIFTTEKSPEELRENKKFVSFMRKGRVDFFLQMTMNACIVQNNN